MPSPTSAVAAAYQPAFRQLDRQEKRVRNLDRKQARDERAYRSWLKSTQRSIAAESGQRQAQLAHVEQGFHQALVGSIGQANQDATQRAQNIGGPGVATPSATAGSQIGAVGDPLTGALQGGATGASAAAGAGNVAHIAAGGSMLSSVSANNLAFVAAQSAKRKAATLEAISKLADARGDLAAKRAADSAKAEADAQAQAAEMAWKQMQFEADQNYRAAQLDQSQQRIDSSNVNQRVNRRLARQRIGLSKQAAKGKSRIGGVSPSRQAAGQEKLQEALVLASNPEAQAKRNIKGEVVEFLPPPNLKGGHLPSFHALRDFLAAHGYGAFAGYAAYKRIFPNSAVPLRHIAAIQRAYGFRPPR